MRSAETLLIQTIVWVVILCLTNPTPKLRISHQSADPMKTPTTISAGARCPLVIPTPRAAKAAMNEKIVIGFVIVRNTVETYDDQSVLVVFALAEFWTGFESQILIARYNRNAPPTMWMGHR